MVGLCFTVNRKMGQTQDRSWTLGPPEQLPRPQHGSHSGQKEIYSSRPHSVNRHFLLQACTQTTVMSPPPVTSQRAVVENDSGPQRGGPWASESQPRGQQLGRGG